MENESRNKFVAENVSLLILVAAKLALHLALDQHYGYFRDEFYYLKLGERVFESPTAMPLLAPLLMAFTRAAVGDSLTALHLLPALAGSVVIALTVLMTRELGGRLRAQALAGICALLAPACLGVNSTFSYDSFDQLWWVTCVYILVRVFKSNEPKLWLAFGGAAGLGLFTKETMLFLGFAVTLALLLTSARRHFRSRWIWLGGAIAAVFTVPFLVMQAELGWPSLGYWARYGSAKTYAASPLEFLSFQLIAMNPISAPLWLAGLIWALRSAAGRPYRPIGLAFVILLGLFICLKAKFYFLVPMYPFLFAAGAMWIEQVAGGHRARWAWRAYAGMIVATGLILAAFAMPLLPLESFLRVARRTSGSLSVKQERHVTNLLPQHFADRFGWEEMARQVVAAYQQLPPEDRARVCVFTSNYGEAGAIEFFGRRHIADMPPVLSAHGQYYFWGYGDRTGQVMILVGVPERDVTQLFERHMVVARTFSEQAMPYENNRPICVAYGLKKPLRQVWPSLAHFD